MYAERKVWLAYVTAVPWGVLGVHKFYLRQPFMGCLYFFTGGLLIVGWLYDLATMPDQVYRCNKKWAAEENFEDLLEEEIEELEDEIDLLQEEIVQLRSKEKLRQEEAT